MNSFDKAKPILEKLEQHNYEAYFVGGCVRDMLLQRELGDIDIATSAPPNAVQKIFRHVIPVGIEHGTVIVRYQNESYEVTTFRVDGTYSDSRHPDNVAFIQTIDEDLKRRDFTINALAMNKDGKIIDLFNGKQDLKQQLIRTVGDGYDRFNEDALRIIRALRFSSQLGFSIEPNTLKAMVHLKDSISNIAVERIMAEMTKFFAGAYVNKGMNYLKNTNIYQCLPIMVEYPYIMDKLPESIMPMDSFGEVLAMFHFVEPSISVNRWVKAWKCSNKIKKIAEQLTEALFYYQENGLDRILVYNLDPSYYTGFIRVGSMLFDSFSTTASDLQQVASELPIHSKRDLAINGNDIMDTLPNLTKGPWMKTYLAHIEQQVILGNIKNNKKELKDWIKWNPPETN